MIRRDVYLGFATVLLFSFETTHAAPPSTGNAAPQGSTALQGISFPAGSLLTVLPTPVGGSRQRVVCYLLNEDPGTDTPLFVSLLEGDQANGASIVHCLSRSQLQADPLQMKQTLVVAIEITDDVKSRISRVTLNVTTTTASPLVPNPLRTNIDVTASAGPVGGAAPAAALLVPKFYFLAWPNPFTADTIPTIALNAEYTGTTTSFAPDPAHPAGPKISTTTTASTATNFAQETLPQVHALSSYNIDTGVVYSSLRNRTFGFNAASKNPTETGSTPIIDPVLLFTYYPRPLDAEREWQPADLIPGVSLGISLSSPSSNFYLGLSSEIRRGIQLTYGLTEAKVSQLAPAGTYNSGPSAMASTPATVQKFKTGVYVGFSFNFKSFLSTLFSAAGGAKGGS